MQSSTPAGPNPRRDEVIRSLQADELSARIALALATPAEMATPLVRQLLGRSGVQLGPTLLSAVNALVNIALRRAVRRRDTSPGELDRVPVDQRRLVAAFLAWALVGPAVAAFPRLTVVLRRRSPLWAYPVILAPRLALACGLLVAGRRQLRRTVS